MQDRKLATAPPLNMTVEPEGVMEKRTAAIPKDGFLTQPTAASSNYIMFLWLQLHVIMLFIVALAQIVPHYGTIRLYSATHMVSSARCFQFAD